MKITYQFEPLQERPKSKSRKRPQFKASFSNTLDLLDRELGYLQARNVVLQADVDRADIRLDGMLRSGSQPKTPAVALSFQSKHGPLAYPCDTYDHWQANLRAIALALEALRSVDRYGVTRRGEQYTGWARITSRPMNGFADKNEATFFLCNKAGIGFEDYDSIESLVRAAELKTHPDKGGNTDEFKKVQDARRMLLEAEGEAAE